MAGIDRRLIAHFDWNLFWVTLMVPAVGLLVLYSAGHDPDATLVLPEWIPEFLQVRTMLKQLLFIFGGLIVMVIAISIPPTALARTAYPLYGACVVLLIAVMLFGNVVNGSRRWLTIGGFNLQPAEPMKFALIMVLARYFSRNSPGRQGYGFTQLIVPFMLFLVPMGLIMQQPDLGTAMVVGAIGLGMTLFMGIRLRPLVIMVSAVLLGAYPAWHMLHDYQQRRILTLINPESDPLGSGYHITQSKIAVGSGAFFGKGFMAGTQTQLEFLPEHTTDFIFSVLAEEWGFVGCVLVLGVYFLLIYRLLLVMLRSKDIFQALLVFGVTLQIFIHTSINIGMVVGLFPVVGIPLPLFSYGGSSVLSTMFAIGISLGVAMRRFAFSSS